MTLRSTGGDKEDGVREGKKPLWSTEAQSHWETLGASVNCPRVVPQGQWSTYFSSHPSLAEDNASRDINSQGHCLG